MGECRALLRSGNCGSAFPRALVEQHCHSVCCSKGTAQGHLGCPGTAGPLWQKWLCLEFSLQLCPCLSETGRWDGQQPLRTGYLKLHKGLMWPSVCSSAASSQLRLPAALGTSDLKCQNFLCYKNTEQWYYPILQQQNLCFYGFSKGMFDILRYSAIRNKDRWNLLIWGAYLTLPFLPYLSFFSLSSCVCCKIKI